jgi:hypothetical protein
MMTVMLRDSDISTVRMAIAELLGFSISAIRMATAKFRDSGIPDRMMIAELLCSNITAIRTMVIGLFCSCAVIQTAI